MRSILHDPLTLEQRTRAMATMGYVQGIVPVDLMLAVSKGSGWLRLHLSERLVGHQELARLEYELAGHIDDVLLLQVTGLDRCADAGVPTVAAHAPQPAAAVPR